ncbi:nickel-dependent lactate racemase [soil metagenome]
MPLIELKYGHGKMLLEFSTNRFEVLSQGPQQAALSDAELGEKLAAPIDSLPLDELIEPGNSVLIVVPDATRQTASAQIVNLLVRRLIASGVAPFDIRIIFATGIHRRVTNEERDAILTPFINQRVKSLDHDPRDLARIVRLGETSTGIPVELDRALIVHDRVILVGGISFHYFAGFTGGRKLICPGLASSRTVAETHKLAFDCEDLTRRAGVDTGRLDGNAVHEAFVEAAGKIEAPFAISAIVNDAGEAVDLFCGHWLSSHRAACDAYALSNTVRISERRDLVIASCGGFPHDVNLIQAHKALDAASRACNDGGTIVLLAECPEGLGRADFLNWFDADDSMALAAKLCEKYQVNGQTAWSLLKKAERFRVEIVSTIDERDVKKMRLDKIEVSRLAKLVGPEGPKGYIMPDGAKIAVRLADQDRTEKVRAIESV